MLMSTLYWRSRRESPLDVHRGKTSRAQFPKRCSQGAGAAEVLLLASLTKDDVLAFGPVNWLWQAYRGAAGSVQQVGGLSVGSARDGRSPSAAKRSRDLLRITNVSSSGSRQTPTRPRACPIG